MMQLSQSVFVEQHQRQEKAYQPDVGTNGGGRKRHADTDRKWQHSMGKDRIACDASGSESRIVMRQTHLAEHQAEALADASHSRKENAFCWQLETQAVMFGIVAFRQDGQRDTTQSYDHAEDGYGAHLFAEEQPTRECCRWSRKGHEKLAETRADVDVSLHQAVVADDIAHHARKQQPHPSAAVGITRIRHTHH